MKKLFFTLLLIFFVFTSCTVNNTGTEEKNNHDVVENKIIATWISYYEINEMIMSVNTQVQFEKIVQDVTNKLKRFKINTIFLQVRAFDDCFYESELYPASKFCVDNNNKLKFDVLGTFITVCRKSNIDIHAWINPYRISNDNNVNKLNSETYASKILKEKINDERIIVTDNNIYYNPAYPDVQNYILNCVREILNKYDVDGIHIDDYFYPTTSKNIDKEIYEKYLNKGGNVSLDDFRRICVNSLVSSMYKIVKNYNNDLIFSISPSANLEKNYNNYFADVKLWATNQGYTDYIIPQLYYGFNHETMAFEKLFNEWMQLKNPNNKIIIGLAIYKAGNTDEYAGEGMYEWIENDDIISRQLEYIEQFTTDGVAFYSSSFLFNNILNDNLKNERSALSHYISNNW